MKLSSSSCARGAAACLFLVSACAPGSAADAKVPEAPAPAKAEAPAEPAPAPEPEEKPPARPPSEILAGEDKAWVFSFEGSDGYDKAKASCDEKFKENPAGRARCITKARDSFIADAMEFTRDDAGNDVLVIYRTKSNRLVKVYSVKIEYGEQQGDTVSIKKVGGETGKPVLFSGMSEFKVKLGGEYSIELQDAEHGMLSYDARLNFIANQ